MKVKFTILMIAAVVVTCGRFTQAADAKPADPAVNGEWEAVSTNDDGKVMPADSLKKMALSLKLEDGKYTVTAGGAKVDAGTYETDAGAATKQIDIKAEQGPNKGKLIPSIYKVEKDSMVVCYGFKGERPKDFTVEAGSGLMLVTYKRIK